MGADTKIQWAHHTFNPWRGCTKVSPGCAHCYAETLSKRNPKVLGVWGDDGTRVVASDAYWRGPLLWNREAGKAAGAAEMARARGEGNHPPERPRVFCASLADVFEDRPDLDAPRARLFDVMARTPYLDWLLLTKRPENVMRLVSRVATGALGTEAGREMAELWRDGYPLSYIWVGTTCEDQQRADERIPHLLAVPAAVRFLSVEPMLGPVDLPFFNGCRGCNHPGNLLTAWNEHGRCSECDGTRHEPSGINWVIVGGESGGDSRPFDISWARSIVTQCREAGVPCFVKQLGRIVLADPSAFYAEGGHPLHSTWSQDGKVVGYDFCGLGHHGDIEGWPLDLRVRELPVH